MSNKSNLTVATMGIDIGKNSFHVVGLDRRGAIVLRQKWSRGRIEARLAHMPACLIGMTAAACPQRPDLSDQGSAIPSRAGTDIVVMRPPDSGGRISCAF